MHTTRQAFIAHLKASGLLATVQPLATGEDLAKKGVAPPVCFVAYQSGTLARKESARLHVFVPGFSEVGSETSAADDALPLAEQIADYLHDHHIIQEESPDGRTWQIPRDQEGVSVQAGRFRDKHAFYLLDVPVTEV